MNVVEHFGKVLSKPGEQALARKAVRPEGAADLALARLFVPGGGDGVGVAVVGEEVRVLRRLSEQKDCAESGMPLSAVLP